MRTRNTIIPGRMKDEDRVIRSLKEKGFYRSGIPRGDERTFRRRDVSRRRPPGLTDMQFFHYLKTLDEREERSK